MKNIFREIGYFILFGFLALSAFMGDAIWAIIAAACAVVILVKLELAGERPAAGRYRRLIRASDANFV